MNDIKKINLPLSLGDIEKLRVGDEVFLSGYLYTARDVAHKRIVDAINNQEELPFSLNGVTIYYVGPSPAKPNSVIGAAGPTTSYRMDAYTSILLKKGVKGMIGKGERSMDVINAIKENKAVYFAAVGGAAALISKSIISSEIIAYDDLGAEAVRRLKVSDFPCFVAVDCYGNQIYENFERS